MIEFMNIRFCTVLFYVVCTMHMSYAAPRSVVTSSGFGRNLANLMRLGLDKEGIVKDWTIDSPYESAGLLRNAAPPVIYVAPKHQFDGKFGSSDPPRQLSASEQFHPKEDDPPAYGINTAPIGLHSLTLDEREAIASEFLIDNKYVTKGLDKRALVAKMQRKYGLKETGKLDDTTVTEMLMPRCGVPDGPSEYNHYPNRDRWLEKSVTYKITGYTPDMSQCQVRNAIKRAFRVWEEVTDLTFEMVDNDNADIIIFFGYKEHGDGYPFDDKNGLLAHAFTPGRMPLNGDSHFDESEFWTLGKGRVFDTYGGNSGGETCTFPFTFQGKDYRACTSSGRTDGLEWCATTSNYDQDKKWAFCPHESLFTYGGNSDSMPCKFPYKFLGKTYDSCTYDGRSDGYQWCSTTSDFDKDQKWGYCPSRAHGTEGGNAEGAGCHFPFKFEGYTYSSCTTRGRTDYKLWCGTTADYDTDKKWGFCSGSGYSLFLVAAHEFGHAIGLAHSNSKEALMYARYSYHDEFVLPDDDIRGARDLYGGPRTKYLPLLELEKCGGHLPGTTQPVTTESPVPFTPTTATITKPKIKCDLDSSELPKTVCENKIDSIMLIQEELFIFQGPFLWRVKGKGKSQTRHVSRIHSHWPDIECGVTAAYQRPSDQKLIMFQGDDFFVFEGHTIEPGYPRKVTELGLPSGTVVDDVVFMLAKNKETKEDEERTYYFAGDVVYQAHVSNSTVMTGVPPTILGKSEQWKGFSTDYDAVYRESQHKPYTIFVKGNKYDRYENKKESLDDRIPEKSRKVKKLFRCGSKK